MSPSNNSRIDLSRYVALGDSITSGYADGALYHFAQKYSYANLLAKQFKLFGGGDFKQPYIDKDSQGISPAGNARLILKKNNGKGLELVYASEKGDFKGLVQNVYGTLGPFNNLGVPGAKVTTLLVSGLGDKKRGAGNYNPFFTRMTNDTANSSILSDALSLNPTFFSLFIGNNDALEYALAGATESYTTPISGKAGYGFEESLYAVVDALMKNGAKGVIANLPDLQSLPYFTTIPHKNGKVFDVLELNGNLHPLDLGDLILFDILFDRDKQSYFNHSKPIPKKYVLYKNEVRETELAITNYNNIIKKVALEKGLAFVDVNTIIKTAKTDRVFTKDGSIKYRRKGLFSLDGVHISPFGQALLANEFIRSINSTYDTEIPLLNSLKYPGINFP